MRFIRSAATTLTLGAAALAVSAGPAFAGGPIIVVTPSVAIPGNSVTFTITCGGTVGTATLIGTSLGLADQIQMQRILSHAGELVVTVRLPAGITPGSYSPIIDCGNGVSGAAQLTGQPGAHHANADRRARDGRRHDLFRYRGAVRRGRAWVAGRGRPHRRRWRHP
jgi:hypothetical protein